MRGGLLVKPVEAPRQGWDEEVKAAVERGEVAYDLEWLEAGLDSELEEEF